MPQPLPLPELSLTSAEAIDGYLIRSAEADGGQTQRTEREEGDNGGEIT